MKKKLSNLKLRTKRIGAIIAASILLSLIIVGGVIAVNRSISNTSDNLDTFIYCSNGNFYDVTASNIQTAIWSFNGTTGGTVTLPSQLFTVTAQIEVTSNINLEGMGKSTILKAQNGLGTDNILNIASTESNIIIRNLCIDGNLANRVDGGHDYQQANIYINGPNVLIDSCFLINSTRHNVYFGGITCTSGRMQNCFVNNSGDHGLYVRNGASCIQILGNTFENIGRAGVRFGPNTSYCIADSNIVNNSGIDSAEPAFHSYDMGDSNCPSHHHIFSNNIAINAGTKGFQDGSTATPSFNTWIGNTAIDSAQEGFYVGGDWVTIYGNSINGTNTVDGISIGGDYVLISGNSVVDATRRGIYITGNHSIISNNIISEQGGSGIYVTGSNNTIATNTVDVTGFYGINESGDNNRILYNNLEGCTTPVGFSGSNLYVIGNRGYETVFPTVNVSGFQAGYAWFNTATNVLNVYNGTAWVTTTFT